MTRKRPLARYVLPTIVNPADSICIQVLVPNDRYHIAAFMGQIYALASASQWQDDPAHTALEVAKVWWRVFNQLQHCDAVCHNSGVDEGIENMIRQNPTNPCLLETSIDGTHWCAFADLSLCIPSPSQPGGGTPQPPAGGGQQCYNARMQASSKWLLPTLVNTGDVIAVTNAQGAASDGTVVWNCPNGALFQLGACIGSGSTSGGDPLNTSPHMMLIAKIGSTYYPMYNTSLTVPGGVTDQQVTFQVNDSNLSDNYGDLTWNVCVTNNALGTFTHTFDFTVSNGGFTGASHNTNNAPTWLAGLGWDSPDQTLGAGVSRQCLINRTGFSSRTLTSATMYYTTAGESGALQQDCNILFPDVGAAHGFFGNLVSAANGNFVSSGGFSVTETSLAVMSSVSATNGATVCHAHITITKLVLSGLGADPF